MHGAARVTVGAVLLAMLATPVSAQPQGDVRIGASEDATQASVAVSALYGSAGVSAVVVGRNDLFADNLGGSSLAGSLGGPLLLTDGGPAAPIRPEVLDEINRIFDPAARGCANNPADVFILGGVQAVSATAAQQITDAGYCVQRLEGPSRVETSIAVAAIVEDFQRDSGGQQEVMVARDNVFADSAAGGAFGGRFFIPIVLTQGATLNPSTRDYLFGRDVTFFDELLILGGTAAIEPPVEEELRATSPVPDSVRRLEGPTRDGTAAAIARRYQMSGSGAPGGAMLVNGFSDAGWVYALCGGAAAWMFDTPVVYVQQDAVPQATADYLFEFGAVQLVTVGPESEVSEETRAMARTLANGPSD